MKGRAGGSGGLVYSTELGRTCPECRQPLAGCTCKATKAAQAVASGDGVVRVSRETGGRGGKCVTVVRGLGLAPDALNALAKTLKAACGSGGTAKDGVIEIQGDHCDRVVAQLLASTGRTVKRAGG